METGEAFLETARLSGGRKTSSNGFAATVASKALTQAFRFGAKDYVLLLGVYTDSKAVEAEDMSSAAAATKAQDATKYMKQLAPVVLGAARSIHATVTDAYPPGQEGGLRGRARLRRRRRVGACQGHRAERLLARALLPRGHHL